MLPRRKVIVQLQGGLADQLKRYYLGKYLANKMQALLILNTSALTNYHLGEKTSLSYLLDHEIFSSAPIKRNALRLRVIGLLSSKLSSTRKLKKFVLKIVDLFFGHLSDVDSLSYETLPFSALIRMTKLFRLRYTVIISGYFPSAEYFLSLEQSERKIENLEEKINLALLTLAPPPPREVLHKLSALYTFGMVHIRLGDTYTTYTSSGILREEYYLAALKVAEKHLGHVVFFGISDDIGRAKQLYPNISVIWIDESEYWEGHQVLLLLASSKAIVIGNSGLSSFAGLLAPPTTIKVAPLIDDLQNWRFNLVPKLKEEWFWVETELWYRDQGN
jgi:hypothetical protein